MSKNNPHRSSSDDPAAARRRPLKITPRRKQEIDPQMIALCYYLIASRIVREADEAEAAARRARGTDDGPVEDSAEPHEARS